MFKFFLPPWPIRVKLTTMLSVLSIFGTVAFSLISYETERATTLAEIDEVLCSAAEGAQQIISPIIINEAEAEQRTEPQFTDSYNIAHDRLEQYVEAARLEFVWSIVARPDGTAYELVSNLSPAQQAARADPIKVLLLNPYTLPPVYAEAVKTGLKQTGTAEDNYGSFRSCIVPVKALNGRTVLYGADMNVSSVQERLNQLLKTSIAIGSIVLIGTLIFIWFFSGGLVRDVAKAVMETTSISRLVFMNTDDKLRSTTLEIDNLFGALRDMKGGLKAFSKYVPTSVVQRVLTAGKAEIGGERRELSLLMTDVTDFTSISEQLEPERVMLVMSEYFAHVVAPILKLDGTLDKYVGDAIFAYWNAPNAQSNHAELCCRAALKSNEASNALARTWEELGTWPWRTRFGLHAGDTVFGNVGAPDRMDFTVIGSSVNLASRIEGLNKFYGTEILASERLRELAGDGFLFRSVDAVMPKGAWMEFDIFELLGERANMAPDNPLFAYCAKWEQARAYYKARNWAGALVYFRALAAERPSDKLAAIYLQRCDALVTNPPDKDWDGVQRFDSK